MTILFFIFCVLANAQDTSYFANGQLKSTQIFDKNNQKTGVWTWYYENGKMRISGEYKNGLRNGEWNEFWTDGKLLVHRIYKDDTLKEKIEYQSASTIFQKGKFVGEDFQSGEWKFYKNGKLSLVGHYSDGNRIGTWKSYHDNGQIETTGSFENGIKTGEWRHYHRNGQLSGIGIYKDGNIEGQWKSYNDKGQLGGISETHNGKNKYIINYYDSGDTSMYRVFDDTGNQKDWRVYFPNGRIKFNIKYVQGVQVDQMFYENGQLEYILNHDSTGSKTGEWKQYYENGQIAEVGRYEKGKEVGEWKRYHRNGQLAEIGRYEKGLEVGEWKYYDDKGKLQQK